MAAGHAHHDHGHGHGHGHAHAHGPGSERRLAIAALLTGGFMVVEVAGGLISGSLALLADAGHMLTDFASLGLAWGAAHLALRPADWKRTYGFDRFSVLAAFVNGLALFAISLWIVFEAASRFLSPIHVEADAMLAVAALGLVVNIACFAVLHGGDRDSLNMRSAALHVLGDLLGSIGAIAAALIIMWTGWVAADPLASVLMVVLIAVAAWRVVRDSGHILLEAAPPGQDAREIEADLAELPGVAEVHHVHVWSISEKRPMITLQVRLAPGGDAEAARCALRERLAEYHGIGHATIEIEAPEAATAGAEGKG